MSKYVVHCTVLAVTYLPEKLTQFLVWLFAVQLYMTLKYLLIIDFPKFDSLTAAEMALCGNLGPKCQNLFPLVSD
jgi:hypothetical protein